MLNHDRHETSMRPSCTQLVNNRGRNTNNLSRSTAASTKAHAADPIGHWSLAAAPREQMSSSVRLSDSDPHIRKESMGLDRTLNISGGPDSSYFPFELHFCWKVQEESITMPVVHIEAHRCKSAWLVTGMVHVDHFEHALRHAPFHPQKQGRGHDGDILASPPCGRALLQAGLLMILTLQALAGLFAEHDVVVNLLGSFNGYFQALLHKVPLDHAQGLAQQSHRRLRLLNVPFIGKPMNSECFLRDPSMDAPPRIRSSLKQRMIFVPHLTSQWTVSVFFCAVKDLPAAISQIKALRNQSALIATGVASTLNITGMAASCAHGGPLSQRENHVIDFTGLLIAAQGSELNSGHRKCLSPTKMMFPFGSSWVFLSGPCCPREVREHTLSRMGLPIGLRATQTQQPTFESPVRPALWLRC